MPFGERDNCWLLLNMHLLIQQNQNIVWFTQRVIELHSKVVTTKGNLMGWRWKRQRD
jgi:hypothetical protein